MAHDGTDKHSLTDLLDMPLAFLGFALWRAWVSLAYANPAAPMPVSGTAGQFAYDVVLAGSAIVIALLSSRIAPLAGRRWVYGVIALLLGFSVAANVAALGLPATTDALIVPATLAGGIGSALLILLWCEIYSCLSPTRVALYYALAIIGGVALTFVLQGIRDEYLYGALLALPMLSAALAHRSYRLYVPAEDRPVAANRRLIPWKFFLILALFELVASYSSAHIRSAYPLLVGSHSTVTSTKMESAATLSTDHRCQRRRPMRRPRAARPVRARPPSMALTTPGTAAEAANARADPRDGRRCGDAPWAVFEPALRADRLPAPCGRAQASRP